jgi:hypothetical protein
VYTNKQGFCAHESSLISIEASSGIAAIDIAKSSPRLPLSNHVLPVVNTLMIEPLNPNPFVELGSLFATHHSNPARDCSH